MGAVEKGNPASPDLGFAAEDDAGARGRPQKAPGDGAGLHVDPGGRLLLPARLRRGREPGARSPFRPPAASAAASSLETKLPTLNQSRNATLPPPQPTRRAVLSPSSALALALSSPPALPPRRRCQGPRRGCAGHCSASGLSWAWGSSASQVRAGSWLRVDRAGAEFRDQNSGHKPLPAPPSSRSTPTLLPHLEPGPCPLSLFPPTHTGDPAPRLLARPGFYPALVEILGALPRPSHALETPCLPCPFPGYLSTLCYAPWSTDCHPPQSWSGKTRSPQLL